jgi:hypothetical protein
MGKPSGGDYACYVIFKITPDNPRGEKVEEVVGLRKAKQRVAYLSQDLPPDGSIRFQLRTISPEGNRRLAFGN